MDPDTMKKRTKDFALRTIKVASELPDSRITRLIFNQMVRSGTSVGANYRAVCRARSKADFIAKMGIVQEEADETAYWLEILAEAEIVPLKDVENLISEAYEIVAVTVASIKTARWGRE